MRAIASSLYVRFQRSCASRIEPQRVSHNESTVRALKFSNVASPCRRSGNLIRSHKRILRSDHKTLGRISDLPHGGAFCDSLR